MRKTKWDALSSGNEVLKGKGFYLSYNPRSRSYGFGNLAAALTSNDEFLNEGIEETALCIENTNPGDREWYILNGDFRKEYEGAFPSLKKCKEVYEKNIAKKSVWSSD